ncbi:MAG: DUF4033 domain-containing protein [Cyanobacteria bacterium P01_A01_bin.105]
MSLGSPSLSPDAPTVSVTPDYADGLADRLFIWLFSRKIANALGQRTFPSGYDGFVALSQQIPQGRSPHQQQALVAVVLQSLVPAQVLWLIRQLFSPTQLVCELNAWFAAQLFEWLVGPCDVVTVDVPQGEAVRQQRSGVHIQKCRYLEQSQCVGLCVNVCKLPTQRFFTEKFGIPLTMTPNFEDLSCEMVFGQVPPALETEAVYQQPCLEACPSRRATVSGCSQV